MGEINRRIKGGGGRAWVPAILIAGLFSLPGCEQVWRSDVPISGSEAQRLSDIVIPVPSDAKNVRFIISGGTQDWNFFTVYELPRERLQGELQKILADKDGIIRGGGLPVIIKPLPAIPKELLKRAPKWWSPDDIHEGYYVSSKSGGDDGPMLWVDTVNSRVYMYSHWN